MSEQLSVGHTQTQTQTTQPAPKTIQVRVDNNLTPGGDAEPSSFPLDLPTDGKLYNFGAGNTQKPLLPQRTVVLATHITSNNANFELAIGTSKNGKSTAPAVIKGDGKPVALDPRLRLNDPDNKVDISKWTIMANPVPKKD